MDVKRGQTVLIDFALLVVLAFVFFFFEREASGHLAIKYVVFVNILLSVASIRF